MRIGLVAIVLTLVLTGCATTTPKPSPYGNFVASPVGINQQRIASDAVVQLATLYPPAKTRFELQQPTPDAFGQALVRGLRDQGYALLEFAPEKPQSSSDKTAEKPSGEERGDNLALSYVIDQFAESNLFRITVNVGDQSITRAYAKQDGTVVPAGYWARKE